MQTIGPYEQTLSRQYPGLFVILLDQSASMNQIDNDRQQSKADIATGYVNGIIKRMIDAAQIDEYTGRRKLYAYLSILGYNDEVYPLLRADDKPVDLVTLDENPLGHVTVHYNVPSGRTGHLTDKQSFWVKPKAVGDTDMYKAFKRAKGVVEAWLNSPLEKISDDLGMQAPRSESFPPIIINITDAKDNRGGDLKKISQEIQSLHTNNGSVLIFNCHFTHEKNAKNRTCMFPTNVSEIEPYCVTEVDRRLARLMFEVSSTIPEALQKRAEKRMEKPIQPGARCFVYNANPDVMIQFLRWSTLGLVRIGR